MQLRRPSWHVPRVGRLGARPRRSGPVCSVRWTSAGTHAPGATVSELLDRYLEVVEIDRETMAGYVGKIEKHVRPELGKRQVGAIKADTAPTEAAAAARFDEFTERWGSSYPAILALWRSGWSDFVLFLDYDLEIRRVICFTNPIESINARYRRAVKARGHFPTEQAALTCLYLVTGSLDPTGKGRATWAVRWKPALNAFVITSAGRIVPTS